MIDPTEHFPTSEARARLAARFGLPCTDDMQDWEWEMAAPERFDEFLLVYASEALSSAERFSLMEILLQCVEDSQPQEVATARWAVLEPHVVANLSLHRKTIEYWRCEGAAESEQYFRITPLVRRVPRLAFRGE